MFVITLHVLLALPFYLYVFTMRIESWLGIQLQTLCKVKQGMLEQDVVERQRTARLMRITLRIVEVVLCGIIAMFIPHFSDFMALVGTTLSDTLSFVLPTVFYIRLNWHIINRNNYIEFTLCFIVASIGMYCAAFGTIDAVKAIINDYVM
jgi:vesicular inhibitory amino acid transporter